MEVQFVKDEFASRFYNWALLDVEREAAQSFPFLKTFKGGLGKRALYVIQSLPEAKQRDFVAALVKRFWLPNFKQEKISVQERAMINDYLNKICMPESEDNKIAEDGFCEPNQFQINRKLITTQLLDSLAPIINSPFQRWETNVWRASTAIEGWKLYTVIDVGASSLQLSYYHYIDQSKITIFDHHISLLSWMGIGGQTDWSGLKENDLEPTAISLGKMCDHFLKAVPQLFHGLSS